MSPFAYAWVCLADDLGSVEGAWNSQGARPELVETLLRICADIYLPFLAANDGALKAGKDRFSIKLRDTDYSQPTFRYQQKCLRWLRERYHREIEEGNEPLQALLKKHGIAKFLVGEQRNNG